MPQRLSSYGLASAKDHTAIIDEGIPGVEGRAVSGGSGTGRPKPDIGPYQLPNFHADTVAPEVREPVSQCVCKPL